MNHFSSLPWLLEHALPERADLNPETLRKVYRIDREKLDRLQSGVEEVRCTFGATVFLIGKLLIHTKSNELTEWDITTLGEVLSTLGDTMLTLDNMHSGLLEAEAGLKHRQ